MRSAPRAVGTRSTVLVLLLMILTVFLPIATVHGIARLADHGAPIQSKVPAPRPA